MIANELTQNPPVRRRLWCQTGMTDKGFYSADGAITPAAFRTVSYIEDRLAFFRGKRARAERKLRKAMKRRDMDANPHAWADPSVDDAARVLSFYNDVVKMLEDMEK